MALDLELRQHFIHQDQLAARRDQAAELQAIVTDGRKPSIDATAQSIGATFTRQQRADVGWQLCQMPCSK